MDVCGAERLVVDAAVGLQKLGHTVDIYTSYHNPKHCFEETRDGTLRVHVKPALFPRSLLGRFHIVLAHLAQLQLTLQLVLDNQFAEHDIFFVDQLSTCVPILRDAGKRVVFYCHFPDKLLAAGEYVDDDSKRAPVQRPGRLKRLYRLPMDWLEEVTTRQADVLLANSLFTVGVFKKHFPKILKTPRVVYPGINGAQYAPLSQSELQAEDVQRVLSDRPTLLSINRIEGKKNLPLAVRAFAGVKASGEFPMLRLVIAGGHDPRLQDNRATLDQLLALCDSLQLTTTIVGSSQASHNVDVLFLLNFSATQRRALLNSPNTRALLYTPTNEHFGIGPVEGMRVGLPVLACRSGGPMESVHDPDPLSRSADATGYLRASNDKEWTRALFDILRMSDKDRQALSLRAKRRAETMFGLDTMAHGVEAALQQAVDLGPLHASNTHELLFVLLVLTIVFGLTFALWLYERYHRGTAAPRFRP
ncbi:UDP-Glycosyltransferase/glycogen phosphorylase [Auriculariales sp. MPI-PUGE-AT-0066]|nr:UDP-Glycosyltransferase/glycogen phosphorylase [Auriculariales sp. MPI-PUGE-AT-0066]